MIFQPDLIGKVLDGRKTETRRPTNSNPRSPWFADRCGLKLGGTYAIQPGRGHASVGRLEVTHEPRTEPLHSITEPEAEREGFANRAEFLDYFADLHPAGEIHWVWVIRFRVVSLVGREVAL